MGYDCGAGNRTEAPMRSRTALAHAALLATSLALCACAPSVTYVADESDRPLVDVESFADSFDTARWERVPSGEAVELRNRALAALRAGGEEAAVLADLLTSGFSASRGVPVHVEATRVDGQPVWIVIEVYGPDGGTLDRTRLWVLSRPDGAVRSSATYR